MYKTIKKLSLIILLLSQSIVIAQNSIKEIFSVKDSLDVLNKSNEKSLVLFDVDEVLIYPVDRLLIPRFFLNDSVKVLKREFEKKKGKEIFNVWSNVLLQSNRVLIEPEHIIDIITSLQRRNVKVLGLTKLRVGKYGKIPSLEEHRFNHLMSLGIDFRVSFDKDIILKKCAPNFNCYPVIYKGIIFSNESSKGDALLAFLEHLNYVPNEIIFFDDLMENLVDVQQKLNSNLNVNFIGYHCKFLEKLNNVLDPRIVQLQVDYLDKYEKWISEEEARKLL